MGNFKIKEGVLDKLKSPCLTIDDSMKSLIEVTHNHIVTKMDEYIVNAVCEMGIDVDKERLVKALTDARSFYNEGYAAAKEKYERKWIPVEEGLPSQWEEVLVTTKADYVQEVRFSNIDGCNYWECRDGCISGDDYIIAWMHKPKRYKKGE